MRRRDFITLLGGSAAAWPLGARAQQGGRDAGDLPRVAILWPGPAGSDRLAAFLGTLGELGYVDGRNIRLDIRFAENRYDRLPALAAELVKARPAVISDLLISGRTCLECIRPDACRIGGQRA